MKSPKRINEYNNVIIRYIFDDARKSVLNLNESFNVVFLDAFSPQKDPTLWTLNFLSEIKNNMNNNSILLSYSKSTPFRSALIELKFHVGKTFLNNVDMGTVASFNEKYISNPLTSYDYKLLSTTSGIFYKDSSLTLDANTILLNRDFEIKNSNRISHTKFLKLYSV